MKKTLLLLTCMLTACISHIVAQQTRGIGIYPGNPKEYFGPGTEVDTAFRNLALHRAVYQSGAHDLNLTAQLLTDGVVATAQPAFLEVLANGRPLPHNERKLTINNSEWSRIPVLGSIATLTYRWSNMDIEADEVVVEGFVAYDQDKPFEHYSMQCDVMGAKSYSFTVKSDTLPGRPRRRKVINDPNKQTEEATAMARELKETFKLRGKRTFNSVELTFSQNNAFYWSIKEVTFKRKGKAVRSIFPAQRFTSVWKATKGDWAYVDLGNVADIQEVRLHWLDDGVKGKLEISNDAKTWKPLDLLKETDTDDARKQVFTTKSHGRYVRVTNTASACLSEIEVYGRNGIKAVAQAGQGWTKGKYMLNGGNWTLRPVSEPTQKSVPLGPEIVATVPATVLSSYYNAGALPDPNFDDNLSMISESFFNRDFLYKRTFQVPSTMKGKRILLNFDGINWKALVVLNGKQVGRIEGAFMRGQFDITDYLQEGDNELLVYVQNNDNPGARKTKTGENTSFNGGVLGADNPTFHATIGWDWITTIPGREVGIWNDVFLTATEAVTISDPLVNTTLADGKATMTPSVFLKNHLNTPVKGTLKGYVGDIQFEKDVILAAASETEIVFSPEEYKQLAGQQMKLWWPNGYGKPHLYKAGYTFRSEQTNTPALARYTTGIREVTYKDETTRLQLYINGQRFIPLGGNWGFSENHLNYRAREYDIAVGYHRQMNCTMIRNWVGQTGDEEFYEACDRHGIMVWQDFWLANPADGPNPHDEPMFMANANDYMRRIRRHPSIALYCGRNEGYPPETLDKQLAQLVQKLVPGALYFPSSADDGVSGHGPYRALPIKQYFEIQTGKLHSERGMPNVPNYESLCRMLAPGHLWPQNEFWGKHDFTQKGAQYGSSFNQLLAERFGEENVSGGKMPVRLGTHPAKAYTALAQWQNYDGYRAMFESANLDRQGLIIWMSHSCWPSMVWQTYDYYFDPTAAFFGIKKACEPLHVQYNASTAQVQLVNLMKPAQDVKVKATIYNLQGKEIWNKTASLHMPTDSTVDCFRIPEDLDTLSTNMMRLQAVSCHNQELISTNTYMLWGKNSRQDIWKVGIAQVSVHRAKSGNPDEFVITNTGSVPALMIRLNLCGSDGEQILPVKYSDNYFHLLPGERMPVTVKWKKQDARGTKPVLHISGLNVKEFQK
ncbi:MAG: discoidin domain-containing protein [Bacteroidaceae bacterium]|nr:discoidin domain-containing protein [Bacteroidaceae bacterium]